MRKPEPAEIATAAKSINLAVNCVSKTLRLSAATGLLTDEQVAELNAVRILMLRIHTKLWQKYPIKEKP